MEPAVVGLNVTSLTTVDGSGATVALGGAVNVVGNKDQGFTVTFNEAVDSTTVTTTQIKMYKGETGSILSPIAVPTLNTAKTVATVKPAGYLADNTTYRLVLSADIKNADGTKTLGAEKVYTFTTGQSTYVLIGAGTKADAVQLALTSTVNASTATGNKNIDVQMSKALLSSSVTNQNVKLYNVTDSKYVANPVQLTGTDTIRYTSSVNNIDANKQYRLEIGAGVLDFSGAAVVPTNLTFTTYTSTGVSIANPNDVKQADYTTALANTTVWPKIAAGTLDQDNPAPQAGAKFFVKLTSNAAIDESSINGTTVLLQKWDTTNSVALSTVDATLTYDSTFKYIQIIPKADLADGANYRITLIKNGVQDIYGNKIATASTTDFKTYDLTAPTVTKVQFKSGANSFVDTASGLTDVDQTKANSFKFVFSEKVGVIDYRNTGNGATSPVDVVNAGIVAANATFITATDSIMLWDYTTNKAVNSSLSVSTNSGKTEVTFTVPANTLTVDNTYGIYIAGKNGLPTGSPTTAAINSNVFPFADLTDGTANNNRMVDTNLFTFSTKTADTALPKVTSMISGSYATGTALTAGQTNVDQTKDVQIVFNKLMNTTTTLNATNIALESYNTATGTWSAVGGFVGAVTATTDSVKNLTYITIAETNITTDTKYRVRIIPESGANKVVDTSGNVMAAGYNFEFTTNGTLAMAASSAGAKVTVTADAAVGATALTTTLAPSANDVVAVEMANGQFFFDTVASANGTTTNLNNPLPVVVSNGASIVNMTTRQGSFAQMETGYNLNDPLAIQINGVATDKPNVDTINSTTVTLSNGGTAVAATVEATIIGNNAYVTINPTDNLAANTQYTVSVLGVQDALGNTITPAQTRTLVTGAGEIAQLNITSVTPADVATGVKVNAPIVINFNEAPTNRATDLTNGVSGAAATTISLKNPAGTFVAGTIAWSNSNKTATITPTAFLANNAIYELQIGGGLVSSAASATTLTSRSVKVTYNFTTEEPASVDPAITSAMYYDQNGDGTVNQNDLVIVQFNTAINSASVVLADFALNNAGRFADATDDATVSVATDGLSATIVLGTNPIVIPNSMKINAVSAGIQTLNGVNVTTTAVTVTK